MPAQSTATIYFSASHQKSALWGVLMALLTMLMRFIYLKYNNNLIVGTDPAKSLLQIGNAHGMRP